ncbi:MAG: hypothetical protein JJT77_02200 [Crocinitomicaceae bacterium]|nr:hypothetical protein [Crocinitomicaceae bacterium]
MYAFLLKKEFREALVLMISLALTLLYATTLTEGFVSYALKYQFYFSDTPFLWMVYILLLFVAIGVMKGIERSNNLSIVDKKKTAISLVFSMLIAFLLGWVVQVYWIIQDMKEYGSLYYLEQQWWIFYLPNFTIVLGFVLAGWKARSLIHKL